jgi:hypothetical protein
VGLTVNRQGSSWIRRVNQAMYAAFVHPVGEVTDAGLGLNRHVKHMSLGDLVRSPGRKWQVMTVHEERHSPSLRQRLSRKYLSLTQ